MLEGRQIDNHLRGIKRMLLVSDRGRLKQSMGAFELFSVKETIPLNRFSYLVKRKTNSDNQP